nr:hypothetical protein [uncultured Acetobacterium sp.]
MKNCLNKLSSNKISETEKINIKTYWLIVEKIKFDKVHSREMRGKPRKETMKGFDWRILEEKLIKDGNNINDLIAQVIENSLKGELEDKLYNTNTTPDTGNFQRKWYNQKNGSDYDAS